MKTEAEPSVLHVAMECFQEEKEIGTAMQSFSLPVIAVMVAKFSLYFFLREFTDTLAKVNSKV